LVPFSGLLFDRYWIIIPIIISPIAFIVIYTEVLALAGFAKPVLSIAILIKAPQRHLVFFDHTTAPAASTVGPASIGAVGKFFISC
jgi:hypothetical protein